ncbi:MAG TPA: Asp-tRNA(Asn)/Glu-tRNA(Gln) amidotransferase subunit GatA [Patescibacteria group bacterium]|nr:Asp-tRNA(Asn)/Glu-tRNA(Gln) amidotransferase subunit GatA [Patescibacteria group bacterium]
MKLNELTIVAARSGLDKKEFSAEELVRACLERIETRNQEINAFISVFASESLAEAKEADKKIKAGKQKKLTGIPFAVKDAINTQDGRATGGAKILDNYQSPYEATVISRLRKEGAILVGKNNCDAFGHGASNEHSMYGPVRNPFDHQRVAGGSSGGSAAAVADHQCLFAIGEDTGGSIRQPASFCGLVGLRPSYGRNSRFGIMPMASSLDTVGPLAKTVADAALLQTIMAGHDDLDATTVKEKVPDYQKEAQKSLKGKIIGVPEEYFSVAGLDEETEKIIRGQIANLEARGVKIKSVSLPHTKYAIPVYYIVVPSEDSSNLARLDGQRYGVQEEGKDLFSVYARSRAKGFPEEVKRRIMIGTYALSAGYYDAYYRQAQKVRTLIIQDFTEVFSQVDVLVTATSPFPAFKIGEKKDDVLAMYLADVLVSPPAVAGVPAISVPAGFTKSGLPVGLQIIGPRLAEGKVFCVADKISF